MPDPQNPQETPPANNNEQPVYQPVVPISPPPPLADASYPAMVPASPLGSSGQNTSGTGSGAVIPPGVDGWGWGPFFLTWIWGVFNSVWLSLLVFIPIPVLGLIMAIVLGI